MGEILVHLGVIRVICTCCRGKNGGLSATRGRLFFDLSGTCSLCGCLLLLVMRMAGRTGGQLGTTGGGLIPAGRRLFPGAGFIRGHFVTRLRMGGRLLRFSGGRGGA